MTVTCHGCGEQVDRADAFASAGPERVVWFCRDRVGCRARRGTP